MPTGRSFSETHLFLLLLLLDSTVLSLSLSLLSRSLSLLSVWVSVKGRKGENERKEEMGEVSVNEGERGGENEVKSCISCFNPSCVWTR
jgi:hypothetical protein